MSRLSDQLQSETALGGQPQAVPINTELCRAIRSILTMAERGEIIFFAGTGLCPDGSTREVISLQPGTPEFLMNTALELIQAKIVSNLIRSQQPQGKPSPIIQPSKGNGL